ncbi:mechanosensitive ion channel family protein [Marinimicrobium sp. C2-29]|uniref:mechanosensitive ion channel family protein n=1 Tax=Marinimicrobium sp. C2-29 TaxID=3139825 RepID=UPI0031398A8F
MTWYNNYLDPMLTLTTLWQLTVLAAAMLCALLLNWRLQKLMQSRADSGPGFRHLAIRSLQRLLWPLAALAIILPAKAILAHYRHPVQILEVAIPILVALALIRLIVYLLRKTFTVSPLLKSSESILAILIWLGVAMHLLGWLPAVLTLLDGLAFTLGESRISLLAVLKLLLMVALSFTVAVWLSELINRSLERSAHVSPSMRVGFGKFIRIALLALAFLLALNAAGIDLSSLAVFGGALGIGIGFGLQKIVSNFISGFILVMDRSIKPGDVITVGDNFGWVEALNSRYMVVRNREGVDTLIPNENFITNEVINWSYADPNVRVIIKVQISYDDDPEQAMELMLECAHCSDRVIAEPAPTARLMEFADNGIALQLRVWIADPQNGTAAVKSEINLAIWRAFKQNSITIPFPQRDLHIKTGPGTDPLT